MSPKKLHTFVALREGEKPIKTKALTALHRASQRADAYEGLTRTYQSHTETDDVVVARSLFDYLLRETS